MEFERLSRQDQFDFPKMELDGDTSGDDCDLMLQVNIRLKLDEIVSVESQLLRANARSEVCKRELYKLACRLFDARRMRDRLIDRKYFGDPAWDMLLALYCLPPKGHLITVSGLSHATNTAETTGLRYQRILVKEGLIERGPRLEDARSSLVRLTKDGRQTLERYLTRLYASTIPHF